jgi:hypothetical protein
VCAPAEAVELTERAAHGQERERHNGCGGAGGFGGDFFDGLLHGAASDQEGHRHREPKKPPADGDRHDVTSIRRSRNEIAAKAGWRVDLIALSIVTPY